MPSVLEPSWVGRRVSVRRVADREPDGRLLLGDVVGDLAGVDGQTAVIASRTGLVEVPVALITAARLVLPSTADELALQATGTRGLRPAETEELSGWLLRADHGGARRANSVSPQRQLRTPFDEALQFAHDWYAERGLPLLFQLPVDARRLLDAELGARGWQSEGQTHVLAARLIDLAARPAGSPAVTLSERPDEEWLALYRGGAGLAPSTAALLTRHDDVAFASVRVDGRLVATARGCVDEGWLGIMAVAVDPAYRRAGLAGAVMAALSAWGESRSAIRSYVQVEVANGAAIALYDKLGYWHHHDYHYRRAPGGGADTTSVTVPASAPPSSTP